MNANINSFYTIFAWMGDKDHLNLKGVEKEVFAVIYNFTQGDEQEYYGSIRYLSETVGAARSSVVKALNSLVSKDLLLKREEIIKGVRYCRYKVNKKANGIPIFGPPNVDGYTDYETGGSPIFGPNNNINNNKRNNLSKDKLQRKEEKNPYGEMDNVLLTKEEYQKIVDLGGKEYIDKLSLYLGSTGKKYKSHYATIRQWMIKDKKAEEELTGIGTKYIDFNKSYENGEILDDDFVDMSGFSNIDITDD